jgi:uracil-DNA glycosylase family protein
MMLVGEQPGDQEDRQGHPFVGPAGRMLDEALNEAGIDRADVYITNAVKHFKWKPAGPRRLHQKPGRGEIVACEPWLDAEIDALDPHLIVCLGSTAAQSLIALDFKVTASRGKLIVGKNGRRLFATVHPSSILRQRDPESRHREFDSFVADLRLAKEFL